MATSQSSQDQLLELLAICEDFFAHAGAATRSELDALLRAHGITGGPCWLIDMLGFTRLHLQHRIGATSASPAPETTPDTTVHRSSTTSKRQPPRNHQRRQEP